MPTADKTSPEKLEPSKERQPQFDARKHLELTLHREAGDILKVIPIPQSHSFRVNWYDSKRANQAAMPGLSITYIRESKFLYCRLNADGKPEITYPAKQ